MFLLFLPIAFWAYVIAGPDQPTGMTVALYTFLVVLLMVTIVFALDLGRVVEATRKMSKDGDRPPGRVWRIASGMLSVAACLEIGWAATVLVITYVTMMEVAFMTAEEYDDGE